MSRETTQVTQHLGIRCAPKLLVRQVQADIPQMACSCGDSGALRAFNRWFAADALQHMCFLTKTRFRVQPMTHAREGGSAVLRMHAPAEQWHKDGR